MAIDRGSDCASCPMGVVFCAQCLAFGKVFAPPERGATSSAAGNRAYSLRIFPRYLQARRKTKWICAVSDHPQNERSNP